MRIRMLTRAAGPSGNYAPGDLADFPDAVAQELLDGGYAERVEKPRAEAPAVAQAEVAEAPDEAERAVEPDPKKRKGGRR